MPPSSNTKQPTKCNNRTQQFTDVTYLSFFSSILFVFSLSLSCVCVRGGLGVGVISISVHFSKIVSFCSLEVKRGSLTVSPKQLDSPPPPAYLLELPDLSIFFVCSFLDFYSSNDLGPLALDNVRSNTFLMLVKVILCGLISFHFIYVPRQQK